MYVIYRASDGEPISITNNDLVPDGHAAYDVGSTEPDLAAIYFPGGVLTPRTPAPSPTLELNFRKAIDRRRDKVIRDGLDIDVTGYITAIALQGRDEDQRNLHGLATAAQLRIFQGDVTYLEDFRDRNNVLHSLTPPQIIELWSQGAAFVSAVYKKSWEIKELDPETTDPSDPALWVLD